MKEKKTYSSLDIEELLLNKSYDLLTQSELEFVKTEIDSSQEYEELRATLISVKEWAKEENKIQANESIKLALMKQMEEKSARFNLWEKLGVFLFPSNTRMHKKPGFQLAVMSLVLLLVINLGLNEFRSRNNELALNGTKKVKSIEFPEAIEINDIEIETELEKISIDPPREKLMIVENETVEEEFVMDLQDEIRVVENSSKSKDATIPNLPSVVATDDKVLRLESDFYDSSPKVVKEKLEVHSAVKMIQPNNPSTSQNLAAQEEVIDLLFVAL